MIVGMVFSLKSDHWILLNFKKNNLQLVHIKITNLQMKSIENLLAMILMTISLNLFKFFGFKKLNNQDNIQELFTY